MVAPLIVGAGIGAGATLLSGAMSARSMEKQAARSEALQREFAQHGIQWKVEDAKAAGVHPVFALGASPAASAGIPVMEDPLARSIGEMGQQLGRAVGAQETDVQRAQRHIALGVAQAGIAKDNAMAAYYQSLAARTAQEARQASAMPPAVPAQNQFAASVGLTDTLTPKPVEVMSSRSDDRSAVPAVHPTFQEYQLSRHGLRMRLPYSQEGVSETLENIPWYGWPAVIAHNMNYYGPDWGRRFLREFIFDQAPVYRPMPKRRRDYGPDDPFSGRSNMPGD